jgi:hypothetical protein
MIALRRPFIKSLLALFICSNFYPVGFSQTIIPLYNDSIPNSKVSPNEETSDTQEINNIKTALIHKVSRPSLTHFYHQKKKQTERQSSSARAAAIMFWLSTPVVSKWQGN